MNKVFIAECSIGFVRTQLYLYDGYSSSWFVLPHGKNPYGEIMIGFHPNWYGMVEAFFHEAQEMLYTLDNVRFRSSTSWQHGSDNVVFMFTHDVFTEALYKTTSAWSVTEKPLKKAWGEMRNAKKKKKKT